MKYFSLSYLVNHLKFGDKITMKNGNVFEVEQVHDRHWIDLYDSASNLKTFDLRRLFCNDKILSINDDKVPSFDFLNFLGSSKDFSKHTPDKASHWLPLSFASFANFCRDGFIYSSVFDINNSLGILDEKSWHLNHFIKTFNVAVSKEFNKLKLLNNDNVALILFSNDLDDEDSMIDRANNVYFYKGISLEFIQKIYFINQLAVDRFLALIKGFDFCNFIKARCVMDPYLLDDSLNGKW